MLKHLPADERTAEVEEGVVKRGVALVAYQQAAVAMQPSEVALHHPAVAPEPLARLDAAAGDPRGDAAAAERRPVAAGSVAQVRVQLGGPLARAAGAAVGLLERWDSVDQALQHGALVHVGRCAECGQRRALSVGHQMVMRSRLASVGRVRSRLGAPFLTPLAGIREASALARRQSILPASA